MSSPNMHDPLFHFETHFPERLSRLHLIPEHAPSSPTRHNRRSRAQRQIGRYKTQPITFDEITEVDEENIQDENSSKDNIKNLQEFSKSMDGLVVKVATKSVQKQSKCDLSLPEERNNNRKQGNARLRNQSNPKSENKENQHKAKSEIVEPIGLPPTGLGISRDHRRQRITAKAKRRQMMDETQKDREKDT